MTPEQVAVYVLIVSLCGAAITGLIIFAKWINNRADRHEAERTAAATFDADFIPDSSEVAAQQDTITNAETAAIVAEVEAILDDIVEYVEARRCGCDPEAAVCCHDADHCYCVAEGHVA